MGAGQRAVIDRAGDAEDVERVFDHIVAGSADDMDEQLPGKIAEPKALAHLSAVDRNRARPITAGLAPLGDDLAIAVEQGQPATDLGGAVTGPVIRGDDARMQRLGITEEGEISREVERIEIGASVGKPRLRDAHRIEAQNLRLSREIRPELADQTLGIEASHQHRTGRAAGEFGQWAGAVP